MLSKTFKSLAFGLTSLCFASPVWAQDSCAVYVDVSTEQAKELRDLILDKEADDLDIFDAYDTMKCAKRAPIRKLAERTALSSNSEALKDVVLKDMLFSREILKLDLIVSKSTNPVVLKSVQGRPLETLKVMTKNNDSQTLEVRCHGRTELLSYSDATIALDIDCDGRKMEGELKFDGEAFAGPLAVEIDRTPVGVVDVRLPLIE